MLGSLVEWRACPLFFFVLFTNLEFQVEARAFGVYLPSWIYVIVLAHDKYATKQHIYYLAIHSWSSVAQY